MTPLPSINSDLSKHTPSYFSRLLWNYGYLDYPGNPLARRNRITGNVEVRWHNDLFNYWCWMEINTKFYSTFISKTYL